MSIIIPPEKPSKIFKFDAYSATTGALDYAECARLVADAVESVGETKGLDFEEGRGYNRFENKIHIKNDYGTVAMILHGGNGGWTMLEVKGRYTVPVVEKFREQAGIHRVTRVDSCIDFDAPNVFEDLTGKASRFKKAHGLKGSKDGDWEDHPEDGRTLYIGGKQAPAQVRIYEKGLQPEHRHQNMPNWTRMEVQLRPTADLKEMVCQIQPQQVWGITSWTRRLAQQIVKTNIDRLQLVKPKELNTLDKRMLGNYNMYKRLYEDLAEIHGGYEKGMQALAQFCMEQDYKDKQLEQGVPGIVSEQAHSVDKLLAMRRYMAA